MNGLFKLATSALKFGFKKGSKYLDNITKMSGISKLFSKSAGNLSGKASRLSDDMMREAFKKHGKVGELLPAGLSSALAKPVNSSNADEFFKLVEKTATSKGSFFGKIKAFANKIKGTKGGKVAFAASRLMVEMAVWEAAESIFFDNESAHAHMVAREMVNAGILSEHQYSQMMAPAVANSMSGSDKVASLADIRSVDSISEYLNSMGQESLKMLMVQCLRLSEGIMNKLTDNKSVQLAVLMQYVMKNSFNANFDALDFRKLQGSAALDELYASIMANVINYKEQEYVDREDQPSAYLMLSMLGSDYMPSDVVDALEDGEDIMEELTERDYDTIVNSGMLSFVELIAQSSLVNGGYVDKQRINSLI